MQKKKLFLFGILGCALFLLSACGDLSGDPAADGFRFKRNFYYYYAQECRYDGNGPYSCSDIYAISQSKHVSLRIDSDGLASLNIDGDHYYYVESEYDELYDPLYGSYFQFYQDEYEYELTIYKDGYEMALWDTWNNTVIFYLYELPL